MRWALCYKTRCFCRCNFIERSQIERHDHQFASTTHTVLLTSTIRHPKNLIFNRKISIYVRKFAFNNEVVDKWNFTSKGCVTCKAANVLNNLNTP